MTWATCSTTRCPSRQIVSQIEQYGISFKPTEDELKDAKQEGVPDAVIDAIRKAAGASRSSGASRNPTIRKPQRRLREIPTKHLLKPKPFPKVSTALR